MHVAMHRERSDHVQYGTPLSTLRITGLVLLFFVHMRPPGFQILGAFYSSLHWEGHWGRKEGQQWLEGHLTTLGNNNLYQRANWQFYENKLLQQQCASIWSWTRPEQYDCS
ncbi:hypothetical protein BDW62DRAFT_155744 [Aspergillus aurantiobrunneus]